MTSRDEFVETLKKQIDEWNSQIGDMEAKMREATAEAETKYAQQIAEASKYRAEAQAKLAETMQTSHDAWEQYRASAESAFNDISEGFRKAWGRFG